MFQIACVKLNLEPTLNSAVKDLHRHPLSDKPVLSSNNLLLLRNKWVLSDIDYLWCNNVHCVITSFEHSCGYRTTNWEDLSTSMLASKCCPFFSCTSNTRATI